jgi:hypothetical protein
MLDRLRSRARGEHAGNRFRIEGVAVQGLCHRIVQLTRQTAALGEGRSLLCLATQSGILND